MGLAILDVLTGPWGRFQYFYRRDSAAQIRARNQTLRQNVSESLRQSRADDRLFILNGNGTNGATAFGDNGKDTLESFETARTTYLFGGNAPDSLTGTSLTVMNGGNGNDTIIG